MSEKNKLKKWFETVSPILISPKAASVTVALSGSFFLFRWLRKGFERLEEDPYLNFVSALKHYKLLSNALHGSLERHYKDRNKSYFRAFFPDQTIYRAVKAKIEWAYERAPKMRSTITRKGIMVFDNYKPNQFNTLLLTIHSGSWLPAEVASRQKLSAQERYVEEDIDTDRIYAGLVLKHGGIWIDNVLSRFGVDFNRPGERAIYQDGSESWIGKLWKKPMPETQQRWLMAAYDEFYYTLGNLIENYRFNIIFDGHSMRDRADRPDISFGTEHIPRFYMPVVEEMKRTLAERKYGSVTFNQPYTGGHILAWLRQRYPDIFTCSLEVNKRLYMNNEHTVSDPERVQSLAHDFSEIFNFAAAEEEAKEDADRQD